MRPQLRRAIARSCSGRCSKKSSSKSSVTSSRPISRCDGRAVRSPNSTFTCRASSRKSFSLGVSRQTVLQRVKRGELAAIHMILGKQKGLRIKVIQQQANLFDYSSRVGGQYEAAYKNFSRSKSTTTL